MRWLPSDSHECERTFYPYVFLSPLAPREPPFATFFVFLLSCSSHPHTRTHTNSAALPSQHVPRDPLTTEGKRRKTPSPPPFSFFVLLSRRALTQRCRALPLADFSVRQGPMSAWKFGKRGSEKGGKGRCSDELHSFFFSSPRIARHAFRAAGARLPSLNLFYSHPPVVALIARQPPSPYPAILFPICSSFASRFSSLGGRSRLLPPRRSHPLALPVFSHPFPFFLYVS